VEKQRPKFLNVIRSICGVTWRLRRKKDLHSFLIIKN